MLSLFFEGLAIVTKLFRRLLLVSSCFAGMLNDILYSFPSFEHFLVMTFDLNLTPWAKELGYGAEYIEISHGSFSLYWLLMGLKEIDIDQMLLTSPKECSRHELLWKSSNTRSHFDTVFVSLNHSVVFNYKKGVHRIEFNPWYVNNYINTYSFLYSSILRTSFIQSMRMTTFMSQDVKMLLDWKAIVF